jgi:hypothetical protein
MRIREEKLAQVVREEGPKLGDAQHIQALVGAFMRMQRAATQYVVAHDKELGPAGIVTTLLHAEIISRAFQLQTGRRPPSLSMADLDLGARRAKEQDALSLDQPAVLDYLRANVGTEAGFTSAQVATAHEVLTLIVLAFDQVLG